MEDWLKFQDEDDEDYGEEPKEEPKEDVDTEEEYW